MRQITVTCGCTRTMTPRAIPKDSFACGCGVRVRLATEAKPAAACVAPDCTNSPTRTEVIPLCLDHVEKLTFALMPDVYAAFPPSAWLKTVQEYEKRFATVPVKPKWAVELEALRQQPFSLHPAGVPIDPTHEPVVYFAMVGDQVKIGTTQNIVERFTQMNLPPSARVYVIPGSYPQEKSYHRRFAAERHRRSEWFDLSDRLRTHIDALIEQGEAACPSSVTPRWRK